ncbi:ankyrin repeat containing protein [Emericellopsis cladophorae]|uniref:Ankyrin repeat containing protein n=1 Tax=Emericellopsis cladophorae TaxID=2686198 RepID=A0A9P9XTY2_9HYPO|nr:ankyrin repeat containing protein [Emericellopsis cladophorae]KAI6777716.1 ankyrin repeat containing protein [Emericellopsis cladophorae]
MTSRSYDHVWDFSFRRKCSYEDLHQLSCIRLSGERDWIDDQDFPLPHNIIFGLSGTRLKDELERNPKASKMKDAQGRTALDWATARGQLDDMRILISHGSEVNSMDAAGRTTVLHAVDSHNMEALEILLEAGANPNPQMPGRLARSSPLTSASFGGLAAMVKLLLDYGAEVNTCNPEGRSPLTTAMLKHNHVVFKALADWNTNMATGHVQPPLLSEIAKHADVDTMSIVASSSLSQYLDVDDLTASREALCRREDYDTSLLDAFQSMLPNT